MAKTNQKKVPKSMKDKYDEIVKIIEDFCEKYLNEEYLEVCSELCAALCRKRPSPLLRGRSNTWACGIVHAVGTVNFLFDFTQIPHMKAGELYEKFGISGGTGAAKSKQIRDLMKMSVFDPKWTLPSKIDDNPLIWMVNFNGLPIDIRSAPRHVQEIAFEKGLIPYIPDDAKEESEILEGKNSKVIPFRKENKNINSKKMSERERLDLAQDIMYDAWETSNPNKRIQLAQKALDMSENCADAYILLAQEADISIEEKKELCERAVKASENAIGKRKFKEYEGKFWGILETRPYMRAKIQLADILWGMDQRQEAIKHCKEMLILNPNDNQGIREILINWVILENDDTYAEKLLDDYKDDFLASMIYSKVLFLFKKGEIDKADIALKEAMEANPYVPSYILGIKKMPEILPDYIKLGDETEAIVYTYESYEVWHSIKGAFDWLRENVKK